VKNPKVSVIILSYNRPRLLGIAIKSVIAQAFHDFEIIVVPLLIASGLVQTLSE